MSRGRTGPCPDATGSFVWPSLLAAAGLVLAALLAAAAESLRRRPS